MTHLIWKVSYTFEVPSDHAGDRMTESYVVIARTPDEARKKAEQCLLQTRSFTDLYSSIADATCSVNEVKGQRIHFPQLTLDSDKKKFSLQPKISDDKKTLEFIIKEK